jgi:predicted Zn-dependent peptidase
LISTISFAQTVKLDVKEHILSNGMKILMLERHNTPRVVCHVYYKVGGVNERPGITGTSHFLEHMMFKGTKLMGIKDIEKDEELNKKIDKVAEKLYHEKFLKIGEAPDEEKLGKLQKELDDLLAEEKELIIKDDLWETYMKNGGSGLNASTGQENTGYYATLPSNKVELQMWLESDRMINNFFREFHSEREVIREERRLGENRPGSAFREQLNATFYAASPYSWGVIGWDIDLQKVKKEDMINYYKKYYNPSNAVAVYAGDINPDEIIKMAEKYFGRIPGGKKPDPIRTFEPPQKCEKRVIAYDNAPDQVYMYYHVPTADHPDDPVFDVMTQILNGRTGRLYKSLVKEQDIAISAFGYGGGRWYAGSFVFSARPKTMKGKTCEELEDALYKEIEKLKTEAVTEHELQKAKNNLEVSFIRGLESTYRLAARIGRAELHFGWKSLIKSNEDMKKVTSDDIMRVAKQYFVDDNKTVGILKRKKRR